MYIDEKCKKKVIPKDENVESILNIKINNNTDKL